MSFFVLMKDSTFAPTDNIKGIKQRQGASN